MATSQNGVGAAHVVSSMQPTHTPFLQRGVLPPHCPSSTHAEVQTWLLQNGLPGTAAQSGAALHWTQTLLVVSQTGLPGMAAHAVTSLALHCSHVPGPEGDGTQAGSVVVGHAELAPEPWFPLHCVHCLFVHTGFAAGHVVLTRQLTQVFTARSQTVFVGSLVHATVPLHSAHAPLGRQAGFAFVQGNSLVGPGGEPKSPEQPTQRFRSTSQEPLLPVQAVALVWLHSTQAPATQAGLPAVGQADGPPVPKSPVQAVHPFAMQTGRPLGQSAEVVHGSHANVCSLPGAGQFPPPLMSDPRHAQGLNVTRLPQGFVGTSALQCPSTRPGTTPYTFEHDTASRAPKPQAVSQQTVSTQNPDWHCAFAMHRCPRAERASRVWPSISASGGCTLQATSTKTNVRNATHARLVRITAVSPRAPAPPAHPVDTRASTATETRRAWLDTASSQGAEQGGTRCLDQVVADRLIPFPPAPVRTRTQARCPT